MPLEIQSLDVVVVGRFNPHIITPPWLKEQQVSEVDDVKVNLSLDVENKRGIVLFQIAGFSWQVTDSRLTISTRLKDKNPAELVDKVLDKLPHTPTTALGHNVNYRCDLASWGGRLPRIGEFDKSALQHFGEPTHISWSCKLEQAGLVFGIDVEQGRDAIEVHTNVHRQAPRASTVRELCRQFQSDVALSNRLVTSITNVSVS